MLACHRHENFLDSNFPHFSSVDVAPCHILVYNFHNMIWNTWNGMDSSPLRHCLHCLSLCSRADYVCLLKEFKWKDLNSRVWNPLIRPLCERLWVRRAILELNFNISAHLLRRLLSLFFHSPVDQPHPLPTAKANRQTEKGEKSSCHKMLSQPYTTDRSLSWAWDVLKFN